MAEHMTRAQFYEKYGNVSVRFVSYYKFTFTYGATLPDGKRLLCGYGGSADDIYRLEVNGDEQELVAGLEPYYGSVYDGDTEVEGFYDY